MAIENSKALDETQIRALIDDRVKATRAKDVDGAMLHIASDVLLFDVINPLQYSGSEALKKRAEGWFSSFQGPIGYEVSGLRIAAGEDVAFSHSLNRVSAKMLNGEKLEMWWRSTIGYRKIDGKWMVTHEHNSVPFDVESGKASLGLHP